MSFILIPAAVGFVLTLTFLYFLRGLAIRIGLVDAPHGRKQHKGNVPLTGGIAMFLGFLFAMLTLSISMLPFRSFIAGCALLVFIGVLDDFHELSAKARFIAQTLAALLMIICGKVALHDIGNLIFLGNIHLGELGFVITVIAAIGVINAVNMTDGVDGLAGGLAFIELGFLFYIACQAHLIQEISIISILMACLLAFLCYNFPIPGREQALAFMGDAGSMLLGFALVWFLVSLSQGEHKIVNPVTMLWIMTIPLFDVIGVMLRRLQQRRSIFMPDREHFHHILGDLGLNSLQTSSIICIIAFICGLIGISLNHLNVPEGLAFLSFITLFVIYLIILKMLRKRIKS